MALHLRNTVTILIHSTYVRVQLNVACWQTAVAQHMQANGHFVANFSSYIYLMAKYILNLCWSACRDREHQAVNFCSKPRPLN